MQQQASSPFEGASSKSDDKPSPAPSDAAPEEEQPMSLLKSPMCTRAPFILVNEFCERLAYYGIATNIVTYLTRSMNMSNSAAATSVNIWSGVAYTTPLIGAFLADAWWGRYWTILIFSIIYMAGLGGLTASAGVTSLHPAAGEAASSGQLAFFWTFMYLIALGTGGIKPNVSSFGADQFDEEKPAERALLPRFFCWFYAAINLGAILASTVVVNVQANVSWTAGFAIPCGAFAVAIVIFLSGSRLYRRIPPAGSPFTRMGRVLGGAVAHRKAAVPEDTALLHEVEGSMSCVRGQPKLERTPSCTWLEKACTPVKPAGAPDRWLVTLTEVEELKCVWRLVPVFLTLIVFNAIYAQMTTLFVLQGEGMDCNLFGLKVAPATVSVMDCFSVIIWVVLYDMVIAPFFARRGRPISTMLRIGIGYGIAVLSMLAAGCVEIARLHVVDANNLQSTNPTDPGAPVVPMSVWWQIPQYFLVGAAEVFAMVGSLELFYSQAPDAMRSTCSALQLVATAAGSYLAAGLVAIVQAASGGTWVADNINQGHMQYFFFTLAVLMALTLVAFVFVARRFRYRTVLVKHSTVDVEALALAPASSGAFSPALATRLSADLAAGMRQFSSRALALGSGGVLELRAVPEDEDDESSTAGAKAGAPVSAVDVAAAAPVHGH